MGLGVESSGVQTDSVVAPAYADVAARCVCVDDAVIEFISGRVARMPLSATLSHHYFFTMLTL